MMPIFGTIADGQRLDDPSMDASGDVSSRPDAWRDAPHRDGSEAGVPDDEARQWAKQLLAERRAVRRAERERQRQAAKPQPARRRQIAPAHCGRPTRQRGIPLRFVVGIAGWIRLQPEFLTNVGILLGIERSPILSEQA